MAKIITSLPQSTNNNLQHNDTLNIQGGNLNERYHLLNSELELVNSALQAGDNISNLLNDVGYITSTTLPINTSDLLNDGADGLSTYVETDELGAVAFSNNYNDLSNLPTGIVSTAGLTTGRVPYVSATNILSDSTRFLWDNTISNLEINGNNPRFTIKNNLSNHSWYLTAPSSGGLKLQNHQGKTLAIFTNPVNVDNQPQLAIGQVTGIPSEAQLYIYGGQNGANIDMRGSVVMDQANTDWEGSDWDTTPNSIGVSYYGSNYSFGGTIMGYPNNKSGVLRWGNVNTAAITTFSESGITPLRFGINDVEITNLNNTGFSYQSDFSSLNISNPRWLVDKGFVQSEFVPYIGAITDVDLGEHQIKVGQLEFDQTPTGTLTTGKVRWNDSDGTIEVMLKGGNVTLQVGQELLTRVVNKTGVNLLESEYKVVYISGAQGNRLKCGLAVANNDVFSNTTLGLVTENINNNNEGFVTSNGLVRGINTTGSLQGETWLEGDVLYLSPTIPGQLTKVTPIAPDHLTMVGYVVNPHITQGSIYVKVQIGYGLDALHNVLITTPINNDGLFYDSVSSLWKNKPITTVLGYTPENVINKSDSYTLSSSITYASTKAVVDGLATKQATISGTANTIPKYGTGGLVGSRFTDNGIIAAVSGTFTLNTDLLSSASSLRLYDTTGLIFRGVRANAWTDIQSARFFQIGNNSDNVVFSTESGTVANRFLFTSAKTQFSNLNYLSTSAPVGIFEILNSNIVKLSVSTGGRTLINTTIDNGIDQLQVNGSINTSTDIIVNGIKIGKGLNSINSNTVIGSLSGESITTGTQNYFGGTDAGRFNTSGSLNTFLGFYSGRKNTTGSANMFLGNFCGAENTTGSENLAIGSNSLVNIISSGASTAIGTNAGRFISDKTTSATSITNSILLGYRTSPLANSQTNQIVIGYDANGLGSNTTVIGNSSTINTWLGGNVLIGTTTDSGIVGDKLQVSGAISTTSTIKAGATVRLKNYTVATLPIGIQGDTAYVTDATAPTYLGLLIGGGSIVTPVFYNGTAWVSH